MNGRAATGSSRRSGTSAGTRLGRYRLDQVAAFDRVLYHVFDGFWNTDNYVVWDERGAPLRPVAEMPPKSLIVAPQDGASLHGGELRVAGWAWSGYGPIRSVEVSADAGGTWMPAELEMGEPHGWQRMGFGVAHPPVNTRCSHVPLTFVACRSR